VADLAVIRAARLDRPKLATRHFASRPTTFEPTVATSRLSSTRTVLTFCDEIEILAGDEQLAHFAADRGIDDRSAEAFRHRAHALLDSKPVIQRPPGCTDGSPRHTLLTFFACS
jgi:hypothetical protein